MPLGLACAYGGLKLIDMSIPPDDIPYFIQWALNFRAFVYAIVVSGVAGIVFGLAPALQASKADLQEAMKEGGRGTAGGGRAWLRNTLVVAEVALSLLLLIGASLFVRSFLNLQQANGGFDAGPLMTMRFYMPNEQYATPESKVQRTEDILRRVEALPGVQAAFASNLVPLSSGGGFSQILIEGRPSEKGKEPGIEFTGVSPHMVKTLGLSVLRGRELTDTEAMARTPYAVVNQAMVKRFWPNEDPLGRRFRTLNEADGGWFTIVGVVPDYRHGELDNTDPIEPCAYVAFPFGAFPNTGLTIRMAGDPALVSAPAREAIRASDPRMAVFQVATMKELRERGYWQYFLFGWMFSLYGGIALRARRDRRLRSAVVLGGAADAGDWRPHGARRGPRRRAQAGRGAGRPPGDRRGGHRRDRIVLHHAGDQDRAGQRQSDRSAQLHRRLDLPHGHRVHRQLRARPPGHGGRSAGGAQGGIAGARTS